MSRLTRIRCCQQGVSPRFRNWPKLCHPRTMAPSMEARACFGRRALGGCPMQSFANPFEANGFHSLQFETGNSHVMNTLNNSLTTLPPPGCPPPLARQFGYYLNGTDHLLCMLSSNLLFFLTAEKQAPNRSNGRSANPNNSFPYHGIQDVPSLGDVERLVSLRCTTSCS